MYFSREGYESNCFFNIKEYECYKSSSSEIGLSVFQKEIDDQTCFWPRWEKTADMLVGVEIE